MEIKNVEKNLKNTGKVLKNNLPIILIGVGGVVLLVALSSRGSGGSVEETPTEYTPVTGGGTYQTLGDNADVVMSNVSNTLEAHKKEYEEKLQDAYQKIEELSVPSSDRLLGYTAELNGLNPSQIKKADLNGDGKIDTKDAVIALRNEQTALAGA